MKTIILCGGQGTRLREETEFKPKPMVIVGGKPLIWHIMKIYAHYGYNEFILALGYKADYIKEYFLNQKAFSSDFTLDTLTHDVTYHVNTGDDVDDFKITFVDTGLNTQIGGRILKCERYISKNDKDFMVTYSDAVADINIKKMVAFHQSQKSIGTVTGVQASSKYGILAINSDDKITGFEEKPVLSDWINGGFKIFKREFFNFIEPDEMEHPALKRLASRNELSVYRHRGFWDAVDTYKELEELNKLDAGNKGPWRVWQ
jgi:glucose-1-phosphate cytidylyltransferase